MFKISVVVWMGQKWGAWYSLLRWIIIWQKRAKNNAIRWNLRHPRLVNLFPSRTYIFWHSISIWFSFWTELNRLWALFWAKVLIKSSMSSIGSWSILKSPKALSKMSEHVFKLTLSSTTTATPFHSLVCGASRHLFFQTESSPRCKLYTLIGYSSSSSLSTCLYVGVGLQQHQLYLKAKGCSMQAFLTFAGPYFLI